MATTSARSIHFAFADSSLGAIGVARSAKGVCAILLADHRIVRSDGALSGCRWGPARKRALLERAAAR